MNQQSQQAIKNNLNQGKIFFDLETTGLGKAKAGVLTDPVDIWQLAYNTSDKSELLHSSVSVPFEPGTLKLFNEVENGFPKLYTQAEKIHEKELVAKFGKLIMNNPRSVISGYNVTNYDIPLLAKKFKQYGMKDELHTLMNMPVDDVLGKSNRFLDSVLSTEAKRAFGIDMEKNIKAGARLEVMAKAFGIDLSKAPGGNGYLPHNAQHDIWLTKQLDDILDNSDEAKRLYNIHRHAAAFDESTGFNPNKGLGLTKGRTPDTQGFHSWSAALKKRENQGPVEWTKEIVQKEHTPLVKVKELKNSRGQLVFGKKLETKSKPSETPLKDFVNEVKDEVDKLIKPSELKKKKDDLVKGIKEVAKSPKASTALKIAAAGAGGYAAYSLLKNLFSDDLPRDQYISATSLGKDRESLQEAIMSSKNVQQFNKRVDEQSSSAEENRLRVGNQVHAIIEAELKESIDAESEVSVVDKELGIKGNVDVVAKIKGKKVPIEVKSTTSEKLAGMQEAEKEHESQVNFYAHALGSPGGYVMYVSKDNPDERRLFHVPYSPGKLIRDVAEFRTAVLENRNQAGVMDAWAKQMDSFFEDSIPQSIPTMDMNQHNRSKIRDQASRNSHMFPTATPKNDGNTYNGTRYMPRNN